MPRSTGNIIADSLGLSLSYAQRLLKGVDATNFARFASVGGEMIESNHPAFIMSHLCIYAPRITSQLERDDLVTDLPAQIQATGSKDATCKDDPDGSIYASIEEILTTFNTGYQNAATALREVDDEFLQRPNPAGGRMAELFPTLGSMHGFYVGGHMMMHLGQFSAWRRMQGMGPA